MKPILKKNARAKKEATQYRDVDELLEKIKISIIKNEEHDDQVRRNAIWIGANCNDFHKEI